MTPTSARRAICPGSFDPIHRGHVEIIRRTALLFPEVVVAVSDNPKKSYFFDRQQRLDLAEASLRGIPGVVVEPLEEGLLARYAADRGAVALVKGLRSGQDYDYELPMAAMNRALTAVETVFLPANPDLLHISSSLVKEVHGLGGDVAPFVPEPVYAALTARSTGV
ncbi:pantetheine-phosphate adenylyltransferase [Kocuria sp.]|uniref:pantetheine-phosphate adenylyltransferase n=1 Tax=Kocuria sp. TaxID=1871328 RepID=UPI0026E0DEF2|nr:pantetheine-phosphate adenylyltransferase [Kocuria sp.]MDO5618318.1 pantetheine-phosphate adenylyltransferase [Kocuria sp.]